MVKSATAAATSGHERILLVLVVSVVVVWVAVDTTFGIGEVIESGNKGVEGLALPARFVELERVVMGTSVEIFKTPKRTP